MRMNKGLQVYCLVLYLQLDDRFDVKGHYDSTLHFDEQYWNFRQIIRGKNNYE